MKKQYLRFNVAPKIISRRMRMDGVVGRNACYKSDEPPADPADPDAAAKAALLEKVKGAVTQQIAELKLQNATQVQEMFDNIFKDADLRILQSFKLEDVQVMKQSVTNMASAIAKLQQNIKLQDVAVSKKMQALKKLVNKKETMDSVQAIMSKKVVGDQITLTVQAAVAVMTTGNVVDDGDIPEDILNNFTVGEFVKKRRPKEYIYDMASRRTIAAISEYKTWLEEGDEEGAFAIVAEGAVKPLVSKTLVRYTVKYNKLAGKRVYTEEFEKFRKEAYDIIEDLFSDQLQRNYANLLQTDLIASAASYVGTALDGTFENPTDYHALGAVSAQMETLDFAPDLLVINPQDKWRIKLSQDKNGQFYAAIPQINSLTGATELLGFRVLTTNKMDVGSAILGESGLFKIEDEPVKVRLGYGINVTKDGDGFVTNVDSDVDTNRFRIIAETFFRDWIPTAYTGSFVKFNFADVKAALLAPGV